MSVNLNKNLLKTTVNARIMIVRPLPLTVVFFIFGLLACFYLFEYMVWCYVALVIIAFSLFVSGVISKKLFCFCLLSILLSLTGLLCKSFYIGFILDEGFYTGSGVVASINSSGTAIIEDVTLESEKLKGSIVVYNLNANVGDRIAFGGNLTNLRLHDRFDLHRIASGTFYQMDLSFSRYDYAISYSFRDSILMGVRNGFLRCSNKTTADYIMSLMFGRSDFLDLSVRQEFIAVGSAHVFAVSGLHIGVLVSSMSFILKKLKLKKTISAVIISCTLAFYTYLCSFSPSVIRASLMTVLSMVLFRSKHCADRLSVLSLTAFISLLINPLWICDISFLLSYGAIIGIYLLFPFFKKPFHGLRRFRKFAELLALNTSVSISLIPLSIFFFGKYSLFGILASLVVIPLTSILYVVAFAMLPLLVFRFIPIPLGAIARYLVLINSYIVHKLNILNADISLSFKETGILFWYIGLFIISDYVNTDWFKKCSLFLVFMGLALLL